MKKKKKLHHHVIHHLSVYLDSLWFYPLLSLVSALSLFINVISMGAVNVALVLLRPRSWPWVAAAISLGSGLGSALIAYLIQHYSLLAFEPFMDQSQLGVWANWVRTLLASGGFLEWLLLTTLPLVPLTPIVVLLGYSKVSPLLIFAAVFLGRWIKYSMIGASLMISHLSEWLRARFARSILVFLLLSSSAEAVPVFQLSLRQAERQVLHSSEFLKSLESQVLSSESRVKAAEISLLPRLQLQGAYQYQSTIPSLSIAPNLPPVTMGSNHAYSIGPQISYLLWDFSSHRKGVDSTSYYSKAQKFGLEGSQSLALSQVRGSYIRIQLLLEELKFVHDSLTLAHAQFQRIEERSRVGDAPRLEVVSSSRQELSFELQFSQKQAELVSELRNLCSLVGVTCLDWKKPGPKELEADQERVGSVIAFEPLSQVLAYLEKAGGSDLELKLDRSSAYQAALLEERALELAAEAEDSKKLPQLTVQASAAFAYPNGPQLTQINQAVLGANLTMPLWLGDPASALVAEKKFAAASAGHRAAQIKLDLLRDVEKAKVQLETLKHQLGLVSRDVSLSEEAARLSFQAYQAGKSSWTEVQSANNLALQSRLNFSRIQGQLLVQWVALLNYLNKGIEKNDEST